MSLVPEKVQEQGDASPSQTNPRDYFKPDNTNPSVNGLIELQNAGFSSDDLLNWVCLETGLPAYHLTQQHPTEDIRKFMSECGPQHRFGAVSELPWLPLTMLGPIPVLGHFHPFATDFYGFRRDLVFTVILSTEDYAMAAPTSAEAVPEDRKRTPNLEPPPAPHGAETPEALLEWLRSEGWYPKSLAQGASVDAILKDNPSYLWSLQMILEGRKAIPYNTISLSEENLGALPQAMMEKYQMVCYHKVGDVYYIASSNTSLTRNRLTGELNARIGSKTGSKLGVVCGMAYGAFIDSAIRYLMSGGFVGDKQKGAIGSGVTQAKQGNEVIQIDYNPAYTRPLEEGMDPPEVFRWILFRAISMKASDIHLQEGEDSGEIRVRLNGALTRIATTTLDYTRKVISLIKLTSGLNVAEKRMPQDGRFSIEMKGETIDSRVSTVPVHSTTAGESCVIRLINKQSSLKAIGELDLPPKQLTLIKAALERNDGLILVTGPTGAGKTSTLYAFLNEINTPDVAIVTIEDPVEIVLPHAKQLQVNSAIDLTFARLLRSVLRHDPDIVMVGEIRDKETADHAIQAAQTGHLVFATLHTNDALRSIPRLEALGVDRNQLANSLLMVQAQRLVRTVCRNCRKPRRISQREHDTILKHLPQEAGKGPEYQAFSEEWNDMIEKAVNGTTPVYDIVGCIHCNQTGYSKRRAVMEVFTIDDYARDMIENGAKVSALSQYMRRQGLTDLALESLRMFLRGETAFDEIKGYMKL
jgi:type II secretory ATPase GspE/PulE/Tfp pilus assembly ATPase PilB-like protein